MLALTSENTRCATELTDYAFIYQVDASLSFKSLDFVELQKWKNMETTHLWANKLYSLCCCYPSISSIDQTAAVAWEANCFYLQEKRSPIVMTCG